MRDDATVPGTWHGQAMVLYDRCSNPDDSILADRLLACRDFARKNGSTLLGQYVDYGQAALVDGRDADLSWIDVAAKRPALRDAMERVTSTRAWLLVWHPDRISAFSRCRVTVIERLEGRVLRIGGAIVSPAAFRSCCAPVLGAAS